MSAVLTPSCLAEALELLARHPDAQALAGGTDLLVKRRAAAAATTATTATTAAIDTPRALLCLGGIKELQGIALNEGDLAIGATTSFARIAADPRVIARAPLLARAARSVGGPAIRNMATLGGNIATASPAGDSLTPLYLHDAMIELAAAGGRRRLPITDFISGSGRTALLPGELIVRVVLPAAAPFDCQRFDKVGRRQSMAISVASFAAQARLRADGTIDELRLAWGSVGPTVLRLRELESALAGTRLDPAVIADAVEVARRHLAPISDIRASADYRRLVAGKLLARFLEDLHD